MSLSCSIQDVCTVQQGGKQGLSGKDFVSTGFPAYGAGGMNGFLPSFEFDQQAIILSSIGARCGKCFYTEGKWSSLANVQLIFPDLGKVHPKFLWYQLNDEKRWPRHGTGQPYIRPSDVKEHRIHLPPLEEQKRIAAMLDKADELRRKRRESIAALDSLTQSIFLDLFGDPVTNPKKWPVSGIEDVCELIVDCVNRTAPIVEEPTPFKMIRTTNVKEGKVNLTEVRYVTEEVFNRWNRRTTPQRGDVLLTREAPVGESGIIESDDNVFLGQRLMLYRANRKRMIPEYLLASFRSAFLQHQFDRHSLGSTVKHLPLPVCRNFQVLVPPIALQNEFAKRCAAIQTQRTKLLAAQSETENLFTALQQKAFQN